MPKHNQKDTEGRNKFESTALLWYILDMKRASFRYQVIFRPEPEGGYTVLVPALQGCVSYGKTLKEARAMAEDAIAGYIESLRKHAEPIPSDTDSYVGTVEIPQRSSHVRA